MALGDIVRTISISSIQNPNYVICETLYDYKGQLVTVVFVLLKTFVHSCCSKLRTATTSLGCLVKALLLLSLHFYGPFFAQTWYL